MGALALTNTVRLGMTVISGASGTRTSAVANRLRKIVVTSRPGTSGQTLHASVTLTLPPEWAPGDNTLLYPLVVEILGPDQTSRLPKYVLDGLKWRHYLASGHSVAHASILLWGGSPSAATSVHLMAEQQMHALRHLLEANAYLDADHVALYGSQAGASIAFEEVALAVTSLQCVALLNPVTDWHYYGSFWAERFLGPFSQTGAEQRYVESDIARLASEFRNSTPMLLVHGTADQLAHHGFALARALIENAVHFRQIVYPDGWVSMEEPQRHLLAELEHFIFTWIHDPIIYEDDDGNAADDADANDLQRYETRFDIRRSFPKLKST